MKILQGHKAPHFQNTAHAYFGNSDPCKILLSVDSEIVSFDSFCGSNVSLKRFDRFSNVDQWKRAWGA